MQSPEITVIVACYNVGEYVAACLRSIFHQPQVAKLRILIVDDGSLDNTADVVQAMVAAYPEVNCELIRQSNQGISGARNAGLRLVRTSYVTFVDGDDLWADDYLERVTPVMDEGRADIIAFNASIVDIAGRRLGSLHPHTLCCREGRFSCSELALDAAAVGEWQPWSRIFRSRLLDGVWFPPGQCYEDVAVLPKLYARASHIETLGEELYMYRRRPGSFTSFVTDKHIDDLLLSVREAAARFAEGPDYWRMVHRNLILRLAAEIGHAPRALRRAMFSRVWGDVRSHSGWKFDLYWMSRMLDVCLRSEVKGLLGRNRSLVGAGMYPPANNVPE